MRWVICLVLITLFVAANSKISTKRMVDEDEKARNYDTTRVKKVICVIFLNVYVFLLLHSCIRLLPWALFKLLCIYL